MIKLFLMTNTCLPQQFYPLQIDLHPCTEPIWNLEYFAGLSIYKEQKYSDFQTGVIYQPNIYQVCFQCFQIDLKKGHSDSFRIIVESFRTFKSPLFLKQITVKELFFGTKVHRTQGRHIKFEPDMVQYSTLDFLTGCFLYERIGSLTPSKVLPLFDFDEHKAISCPV